MKYGLVVVCALALFGCGDDDRGGTDTSTMSDGGVDTNVGIDTGTVGDAGTDTNTGRDTTPAVDTFSPPGDGTLGSECNCDSDCSDDGADHPGFCLLGICMTRSSSGTCAEAGSTAECGAGSRCWNLEGLEGICWPDCDSYDCEGACDGDGSCAPTAETSCDPGCGIACGPGECSADNPDGVCASDTQSCIAGECVEVCAPGNPDGYCPSGSTCTDGRCISTSGCPSWMCTGATCGDIISMPGSRDPRSGEAAVDGYYVAHEERYSFLRRDMTMLTEYAACEVARRYPGTPPLGLGDLSQEDGGTPGSDVGRLRHPDGTHTGSDLDLAYYQTDGFNNLQIVCGDGSDRNGNGTRGTYNDGYHCTTEDNIIDPTLNAFFFAKMGEHPDTRVFGVDRTLAAQINAAYRELVSEGIVPAGRLPLGFDPDGVGPGEEGYLGWAFHHHHSHLDFN